MKNPLKSPWSALMGSNSHLSMEEELSIYTYLYRCPRWYGVQTGVRNISVPENLSAQQQATRDAQEVTGSQSCSVSLLQKFKMALRSVEPLPALAQFPLSVSSLKGKESVGPPQ